MQNIKRIERAHDLFATALLIDSHQDETLVCAVRSMLNLLCWVLQHDGGATQTIDSILDRLEHSIQKQAIESRFVPHKKGVH